MVDEQLIQPLTKGWKSELLSYGLGKRLWLKPKGIAMAIKKILEGLDQR